MLRKSKDSLGTLKKNADLTHDFRTSKPDLEGLVRKSDPFIRLKPSITPLFTENSVQRIPLNSSVNIQTNDSCLILGDYIDSGMPVVKSGRQKPVMLKNKQMLDSLLFESLLGKDKERKANPLRNFHLTSKPQIPRIINRQKPSDRQIVAAVTRNQSLLNSAGTVYG